MADFSALKTAIQTYIKQNGNEEITGEILQEILLSVVTTLGDSAINDLVTALANEVAARQNADSSLEGAINQEGTLRSNADSTLQGNINAEAIARANGDTALSNRLGSSITAENTAADQISAEAEARETADTALQGLIDGITDNIENGYVYAGIATPSSTPATGKVFYLALTAGTYTHFGSTVVSQGINILKYNGSAWSLDAFIGIDDELTSGSNNLPKSGNVLENIIKNGSAFDLSAYNAVDGVLATYADLDAALTALNALPAVYKQGGMSMKFVLTSDNNYVQFRCIADEFTTDVTKWQGVDEEPTSGSDNLVKSGGVFLETEPVKKFYSITESDINVTNVGLVQSDGTLNTNETSPYRYSDFVAVKPKEVLVVDKIATYNSALVVSLYTSNAQSTVDVSHSIAGEVNAKSYVLVIPDNIHYIRLCNRPSLFDSTTVHIRHYIDTKTEALDNDMNSTEEFTEFVEYPTPMHQYEFEKDTVYLFKNTGNVSGNVFYNINGVSGESVKIAGPLAPGDSVKYKMPVDAHYISGSQQDGFKISVKPLGKVDSIEFELSEKDTDLQEQIDEMDVEFSGYETLEYSASYQWQLCELKKDAKYLIINTGTAIGGVYYKVNSESTSVLIHSFVLGESFVYEMPEDAHYIYLSNNQGFKVTLQQLTKFEVLQSEIDEVDEKVNQLFDVVHLKVGTYNLGDFSGTGLVTPSDEGALEYRKTIAKLDVNLLATQEDVTYYGGMSEGDDVRDVIFPMFEQYNRRGHSEYNYKAFASDFPITNIEQVEYTKPQGATWPWGHFFFLKGIVNIKEKKVTVISFHWDWEDKEHRSYQIEQIINYCAELDYVVVAGDTNPNNFINGQPVDPDPANRYMYEEDWANFTEAGYTMANGGIFGYFDTCFSSAISSWFPCDNIFVKGFRIKRVWMDTESYMNDHKPICAELVMEDSN